MWLSSTGVKVDQPANFKTPGKSTKAARQQHKWQQQQQHLQEKQQQQKKEQQHETPQQQKKLQEEQQQEQKEKLSKRPAAVKAAAAIRGARAVAGGLVQTPAASTGDEDSRQRKLLHILQQARIQRDKESIALREIRMYENAMRGHEALKKQLEDELQALSQQLQGI